MDNIIDFEEARAKKIDDEQVKLLTEALSEAYSDQVVGELAFITVGHMVEQLTEFGFDPENNPECISDVIALIELMKAYMDRVQDKENKYHGLTDKLCQNVENKEERLAEFLELYYSFGE